MNTTTLRRPTKRSPPARVAMLARRQSAGPAARASSTGSPSTHDELVAVKKSLEAISLSLNNIDPQSLSDAERTAWANEMDRVDLAIARVRVSLLEGILQQFEASLPEIQQATARLEASLAGLQQAVDLINAVAGVLGVVEQIIALAG